MCQERAEGTFGSPADGSQQETIEEGDRQLAEGHPFSVHQRLYDVSDMPYREQQGVHQHQRIELGMDVFLQIEW